MPAEGSPRRDGPVPHDRRRTVARSMTRAEIRARARRDGLIAAVHIAAAPRQSLRVGPPRPVARLKLDRATAEIDRIPRVGLPNYFDDQRFGSVGYGGEFAARPGCSATTSGPCDSRWPSRTPSTAPRRRPRRRSSATTGATGPRPSALLPRSSARSIVTYLVDHPTDFRGAFARIAARAEDALFLGLPEPPVEPAARRDGSRPRRTPDRAGPRRAQGRHIPVPPADGPGIASRALSGSILPLPCCRATPRRRPARRDRLEWSSRRFQSGLDRPADQAPQGHLPLEGEPALPVLPGRSSGLATEADDTPSRPPGTSAGIRTAEGLVRDHPGQAASPRPRSVPRMNLDVLYEDNHCLASTSRPGCPRRRTSPVRIAWWTSPPDISRSDTRKAGNVYVGLVHRLDRPTSGVVLLARTSKAAEPAGRPVPRRARVEKVYWAIVEGGPVEDEGCWTDRLEKDRRTNVSRGWRTEDRSGRRPRWRSACWAIGRELTRLELRPLTGSEPSAQGPTGEPRDADRGRLAIRGEAPNRGSGRRWEDRAACAVRIDFHTPDSRGIDRGRCAGAGRLARALAITSGTPVRVQ